MANSGDINTSITNRQKISAGIKETLLKGASAYEVAVAHGYTGTETEWLSSLKGETGETPDIQVGTVQTGQPGTNANANITGTKENPVLNMTIPRGDVGATPNITIGTVTTGEEGAQAQATITGTPEDPVLNLTIPKGDTGDAGFDPVVEVTKDGNTATVSVTDATHTTEVNIVDGYTPQKNVDYFDGHSPKITGAKSQGTTFIYSDGEQIGAIADGEDGYTPRKGVDYFDGHTPAISSEKNDDTTFIYADGVRIATVLDGLDGNSPVITTVKSGKTTSILADSVVIGTVSDGADGHSPTITTTKSGKTTTIFADGTSVGTISDGQDGHSPEITTNKVGKVLTILSDGQTIGTVSDGADGVAPTITTNKSGTTTTIYSNGVAIGTVEDGVDGSTPVITATKSEGITTIKANGVDIATINDGTTGDDGYSPTASVTKSGSTATITITDKNGTTTAEVHDGQDGTVTIDPTPTDGSANAVSSGGVYDELSDLKSDLNQKAPAIVSATEEDYSHEDAAGAESISFKGNINAFRTARYANKKNHSPIAAGSKTIGGVTVSWADGFYFFEGTAAGDSGLGTIDKMYSDPIPAGNYIYRVEVEPGQTDMPYGKNHSFTIFYEDGSTASILFNSVKYDDVFVPFTATKNIVRIVMTANVRKNAVYSGYKLWYGLYPADTVFVDTNETVGSGDTYEHILEGVAPAVIDTMQHVSTLNAIVDTKTYIDNHSVDLEYVTPEQFQAKGDNSTDDANAIQACIDYAVANHVPVRMFNKYKASKTINISADNLNVYIHELECTGNVAVLSIKGNHNRITIDNVGGNGDAITLTTDAGTNCTRNIIEAQRVWSRHRRCIVLTTSGGNTTQFNNEFHTKFLYAPESNCIYIDATGPSGAESRFIGNGCQMTSGDWAIYIKRGQSLYFSGFDMEGAVKKGIYCETYNAGGLFRDIRAGEMIDMIDSDETDPERGLLLKGAGIQWVRLEHVSTDYRCIDVSECLSFSERWAVGHAFGEIGDVRNLPKNKNIITRFADVGARDEDGETVFTSQCIVPQNTSVMVWFDKKYVIAPEDIILDFSSNTVIPNAGLRLSDTYSKILPTVMNVIASCTITLCESYNPIANNRFIVIQETEGATAQIYDSNGTLVFDGATLGAGRYEVRSVIDPSGVPSGDMKTYLSHMFLGHNMLWLVNKLT